MQPHRKRIKRFHEPGDVHELTFSCYQRLPLLTNDLWRQLLCTAIDRAISSRQFGLVAFVLMPEHVHLLVYFRGNAGEVLSAKAANGGGVESSATGGSFGPPVLGPRYPTASPIKSGVSIPTELSRLLAAVKRPFSGRIKKLLEKEQSPLLSRLTVIERPGKTAFRFWQEGPGYDRNLTSQETVESAIDYIHLNPVRRGLAKRAVDWKWSSARWFASDAQNRDPDLPTIHGPPAELFD